ncbi:MAG: LamG-like jellyroll fold domain-containing protein [Candidatus Paceibacteria bacterium]
MKNIYTYISSIETLTTIIRTVTAFLSGHKKAMLLLICFVFLGMGAPVYAQVTLSGTVYSDAGVTPDATSRTINVAIGTSTPGVFASTSMPTSGAYTITIPAGNNIASGTPILVWIDGGTVFGSVVTKASSSFPGANITGLNLYRDRLIVRHEGTSATSTTINDLSFYTIAQDADVTHATTSNGEIVVRSGVELYVWGGDTFAPGGAVTVAGNAGAGATEGSMTMGASSVYTAGGNLRLAGSLSVPSSATFNAGSSTIFFVASTTGKTISAPVTSIGNVTFVGNGGGWSFTSSATTSNFTILVGSVTAPSSALAVQGTYQNYGTFTNNGGKMTIIGAPTIPAGNFPSYTAGLDTSGSAAGTGNLQINQMAVSGNGRTLYVGKAGNATACSQTAGSAVGCELMVIDIANTAAPAFVGGRDANGDTVGTGNVAINYLLVSGNYLYVAKAGSATACTQSSSTASGCELMVFDISSTTNPVFVASRDMDGTATGVQNIAALSLAAKGTSLYVAKAASGATACSTTALNCELMVFDISSTTNPTYQTGRDASGSAGGTQTLAINSVSVVGDLLLAGKAGSATACSQTAGSAVGCELMVFDISSTTNPTYISGRDVSGSAAGTGNLAITFVTSTGTIAYVGKAANVTNCSQDAGAGIGCELMAFDISSTTNPVYVRGLDASLATNGDLSLGIQTVLAATSSLFIGKLASALPCEQLWNLRTGCELLQLKMPTTMNGTMTGASRLNNLTTLGLTEITTNASTSNLTIASSSIFTAPSTTLSLSGNFTRAGEFRPNQGTIALLGTNQTLTAPATTTFYNLTQAATTAATTTFSTSGTWQIANNLTLAGSGAGRLALRSATDGVQWTLLPLGSTSVSYVNVKDSLNSSSTLINCAGGCTDSGNNTNWDFTSGLGPVEWNGTNWTLFETITIDETNIDEDLTDFPVYVDLSTLSSNFWTTTPASAALVGTDIRVTTSDNVEVPRELVFASSTLQTGELHFKAPLISATADTVFKIWYNGSTAGDYADDATYGAENVWTNNFLAVYHMQDDPTGTTTDSTRNNFDAGPGGDSLVTGALGSATSFSNGAKTVNNFTSYLSSFSAESWIRPTDLQNTGNFYTIIDLKDAIYWGVRDTNDSATVGTNWSSYYSWNTSANTIVDDVFQHLYVEFDDMTDTATDPIMTNNGNALSQNDNTPTGTHLQPTNILYIGSAFGFDPFVGDIDELRISSTTRSFAWRRATYLNQSSTTTLISVNKSVGSSTLAAHTAGQVTDAFSSADKTNETLFAFKLTPLSGTATVTAMTLTVSGVSNVVDTDFSNIRLYRDNDSDRQYDASDAVVDGSGVMSITGDSGTITFLSDFLATTSLDYIVVADFTAPINGSFMTISLKPSQITVTDANVVHTVFGSVEPVQHSRNNRSGGGNSSSIGGAAPVGDGNVSGGGDAGGEVIGNDPDFFWPSSHSGSWTSGVSAYDQTDSTYATTNSVANHQYADHSLVVPGSNTVQGIIVKLELSGTTGAGTVDVQLSWDGGNSWTSTKSTPTLTTTDAVYTLGSPSDLWGRSWSTSDFSNANFRIRVIGNVSSNTIRLDALQVRVYHTAGGGGGGGGGSI